MQWSRKTVYGVFEMYRNAWILEYSKAYNAYHTQSKKKNMNDLFMFCSVDNNLSNNSQNVDFS